MNILAVEPEERKIMAFSFLLWTVAAICSGWAGCHYYERPRAIPVIAHDQVRQSDGSLIAARVATPQPPQQIIPAGDHVTATGHVLLAASKPVAAANVHVVQGVQVGQKSAGHAGAPADAADSGAFLFADNHDGSYSASPQLMAVCQRLLSCPAERLDLTTVMDKHGQQDLLVSTPGGTVETATFAPAPLKVEKAHPWMIGPSYGRAGWGIVAGRQFQALPVTVGIDAFRDPQYGLDARVWGVLRL